MAAGLDLKKNRGMALVASVLLIALMLLLRPYNGIRHDSILYFGQALHVLEPENFNQDLFFAFGSQSDFTVFPYALARLIDGLGVGQASLIGLLMGFGLFLICSALFANEALPKQLVFWGIFCLIVWPSSYGGFGVFRFQEPYLTGRTYAEPLVIAGMALVLMARRWLSLIVLIGAASLHPLQAIPGLLVWWGWQLRIDKRWFTLMIFGAIALLTAGVVGIAPFKDFLTQYDEKWLEIIKDPNRNVYMLMWPPQYWIWLGLDFFLLIVALPYMPRSLRQWAEVVLTVTVVCCVSSIVFVDWLHSVLFSSMQLWRAQWLLHWAALLCVPLVIYGLWLEGQRARLIIFSATLLAAAPYGPLASVFLAIFTIPLYLGWPRIRSHVSPVYVRALYIGLAFALMLTYIRYFDYLLNISKSDFKNIQWSGAWLGASHPMIVTALVLGAACAWKRKPSIRFAISGCALGLLVTAALHWDQRSERNRIIEERAPVVAFNYPIEKGASVFWYGELLAPWVLLHRSSYWSDLQQAGLLFNRGTAIEAKRRNLLLEPLLLQGEICNLLDGLNRKSGSCDLDISALHDPCRDSDARLDYIIVPSRLPIRSLGSFVFKDGQGPNKSSTWVDEKTFYLYACRDVP